MTGGLTEAEREVLACEALRPTFRATDAVRDAVEELQTSLTATLGNVERIVAAREEAAHAAGVTEGRAEVAARSPGVELIAAERRRQIDTEGWTPEHDAAHADDALARAAACYALPTHWRDHYALNPEPKQWPWDARWWKPTPDDRIRELTKAGALIAAEIDRLRAALAGTSPQGEGGRVWLCAVCRKAGVDHAGGGSADDHVAQMVLMSADPHDHRDDATAIGDSTGFGGPVGGAS